MSDPHINPTPDAPFDHWAVVELLGHVRIAGRVTEEERFGSKLGRVDIPTGDATFVTQYFSGNSVYRITPTTEALARQVAAGSRPAPVHQLAAPERSDGEDDPDNEYEEDFSL